jgi:hypothetical protein
MLYYEDLDACLEFMEKCKRVGGNPGNPNEILLLLLKEVKKLNDIYREEK